MILSDALISPVSQLQTQQVICRHKLDHTQCRLNIFLYSFSSRNWWKM